MFTDDPILDDLDDEIEVAYCEECLQPYWNEDDLGLCKRCRKNSDNSDYKKGNNKWKQR
jgi:hypothetical protein